MSNEPGETERWLGSLRRGDADALAALLDHYRPRLRQMVRARMDRQLTARVVPSDVIQEVYLDAKRQVQTYLLRNGATKWGVLPTPATLTDAASESPIFERFPPKLDLAEEFYWHLRADPAGITTLVTSPAGPAIANKPLSGPPKIEDLDGKQWPVMWTKEVGRGRVFVSGVGHNYFTFNDPYFRIILLRAMASTMHESFDPFKPLVTLHLQR